MDQNKKIVLLVVAMLVVAGFAYWGVKHGWFKNLGYRKISNTVQDLPITQVPSDMPSDIVLATNPIILHSYTAAIANGQTQSTLIYNTQDDPKLLMAQYNDYLIQRSWLAPSKNTPASGTGTTPTVYSLNFSQPGAHLAVSINVAGSGKGTTTPITVAINLVRDMSVAQVIAKMPAGLPAPAGSVLAASAYTQNGKNGYAMILDNKKTIKDNYDLYKTYCTNSGWQVTEQENSELRKDFTCTKGSSTLMVNIAPFSLSSAVVNFKDVSAASTEAKVTLKSF